MLAEQNFVFILVRPNFLGNIGSVARVMKNFGFDQLRLVSPPKNYLDSEARRMALDAFDVLRKARVFDSLPLALEDVTLAVGSSSGQYRRRPAQNLTDLSAELFNNQAPAGKLGDKNTIAMIFGDERNGMTNEEIDRCHKLMRIESNPQFPSLNLAQALGIVAYQLSSHIGTPDNLDREKEEIKLLRMTGQEEDQLIEKVVSLMDQSDFSRSFSRTKVATELRSTLQRLDLSQREGLLWRGFLSKIMAKLPPAE
jgi:TrmH family RNA methyltransferase